MAKAKATPAPPEIAPSEPTYSEIASPRKTFLELFGDGLMPRVGKRYALECVEVTEGGIEDIDPVSAKFRLVRIYA